jgi:hypothetical protein
VHERLAAGDVEYNLNDAMESVPPEESQVCPVHFEPYFDGRACWQCVVSRRRGGPVRRMLYALRNRRSTKQPGAPRELPVQPQPTEDRDASA